ncbi:unnamed protein product [Effrenium voratum]|nr:unnamed protein product [Effrenium voratum]
MKEPWLHRSPLIEKGSLLVAKPGVWSMDCPFFHKSVILITEHEEECSMGFVLNRPTPRLETYGRLQFNVWYGGPCQGLDHEKYSGQWQYCLHTRPDLATSSEMVAPDVFLTEPWAASAQIMEGKADVDDFMLLVGHCAWGPGQLQAELDEGNTWEMVATDLKALLGFLPRQQKALRRHRALSRGLPLWRRLYQRLAPSGSRPSRMMERYCDESLMGFVKNDLALPAPAPALRQGQPEDQAQKVAMQALHEMQRQPLDPTVQENCCEALRTLVVDQETRSFISSLGAIDLVLAAMEVHGDSPGVQGHCAGTLTHLAAGEDERQQIFQNGGLEVVVRSMQEHEMASLVQYKGCAVLANLAASTEEQLRVAETDAIAAAVRAMELHGDERLVQDYCIGALFNISRAPQNMLRLLSAGGALVVKAALERHPDAPTVLRVGQELAQALEQ